MPHRSTKAMTSLAAPSGVISNVFRIIEVIHAAPSGSTLKQICEATAINKSTAHRLLKHMKCERYLVHTESGSYLLGPRLSDMGAHASNRTVLQVAARPILWDLWRSTQETVNLAVLDNGTVFYVDVIDSSYEFRLAFQVGARCPVHATSLGRAICAFLSDELLSPMLESLDSPLLEPNTGMSLMQFRSELDRVRCVGYSVDDEETTLGALCIGVPILDKNQEAVAAIGIAGPVTRIGRERLPLLAAAVIEASSKIAAAMGLTLASEANNTFAKQEPPVASGCL